MSFNSLMFLFVWLPIVCIIYAWIPIKLKNIFLVFIGLFFYSWQSPKYLIPLIIYIIMNYSIARWMSSKEFVLRKQILIFGVMIHLFILSYFKYYGFILESLFNLFNLKFSFELLAIPLGISFIVFQSLGYLFDVYYQKVEAQVNLIHYALYIVFFPKILMGPITPYTLLEPQFNHHPVSMKGLDIGAKRFIIGLFQKVVLANTFGMLWGTIQSESSSMLGAWLGIVAYTLQIYFDFNGYSHMAIGLAHFFGFHLAENFNYPYIASSITDFWRRWHMSLSYWFRDYVYIPLGGNRVSVASHIRNLLIIWMLTGLWHGANFTFIVWGLYYGVLLILEKYAFHRIRKKLPIIVNWLITIVLIMIGWVFFASSSIQEAIQYLGQMFSLHHISDMTAIWYLKTYFIYFVVGIIGCTPLIKKINDTYIKSPPVKIIVLAIVLGICVAYMVTDTYSSFLYFNF